MRYVYVIKNLITLKVYVGQTNNPDARKRNHWSGSKRAKGHLYDSMRKYGLGNFEFRLLEECEDDQVDDRERFWISHFDSTNGEKGYNSESGGHVNKVLAEDTKEKIASKLRGVKHSPERVKKSADARRGIPNLKNRRENNPERGKAISEGLKGKPLSEAHKRATSEGLKRYMEQRGEWHPSDEARQKMSVAQREAHARRRVLIDPMHPDAQAKVCPQCMNRFLPKTLRPSDVERHKVKRWCTRSCALVAHNKRHEP